MPSTRPASTGNLADTPRRYWAVAAATIAGAILAFQFAAIPAWRALLASDLIVDAAIARGPGWLWDANLEAVRRSERALTDEQLIAIADARNAGADDYSLVWAAARDGRLPRELVDRITRRFVTTGEPSGAYWISILSDHHVFGEDIEAALATAATQSGLFQEFAIEAIADIGVQRPLSSATIETLLELVEDADTDASIRSKANVHLQRVLDASAGPEWAVERYLAVMLASSRDFDRIVAVEILLNAGRRDEALGELRQLPRFYDLRPLSLSQLLQADLCDAFVQVLHDPTWADGARASALHMLTREPFIRDQAHANADDGWLQSLEDSRPDGLRDCDASIEMGYALQHDSADVSRMAFTRLAEKAEGTGADWDIDWPSALAHGLRFDDEGVRYWACEALKVSPLSLEARESHLVTLLRSDSAELRRTGLYCIEDYADASEILRTEAGRIAAGPDPGLAELAEEVLESWYPDEARRQERQQWIRGTVVPGAEVVFTLVSLGFGSYFVARFAVYARARSGRMVVALAVCVIWSILWATLPRVVASYLPLYWLSAGAIVVTQMIVLALHAVLGLLLRLPIRR